MDAIKLHKSIKQEDDDSHHRWGMDWLRVLAWDQLLYWVV